MILAGSKLQVLPSPLHVSHAPNGLLNENERGFTYLRTNERQGKPRTRGITEIRAAYYTPFGKRYFEDILETMGTYVDSIKFAGGSFTLMPRKARCPGFNRRLY